MQLVVRVASCDDPSPGSVQGECAWCGESVWFDPINARLAVLLGDARKMCSECVHAGRLDDA